MSEEDIALIALPATSEEHAKTLQGDKEELLPSEKNRNDGHLKSGFIQRVRDTFRLITPNMTKFRSRFQQLNCFKTEEEENVAMVEMPRHRSFDIGVGFTRRMSLFLFTKRSVCVHPYHPYTPKQTTRKIYKNNDD